MMYEVEQKFPVDDAARLQARLEKLGAHLGDAVTQEDTYLAHPQRDFAQTDEALRIRRQGSTCCITYKGPKVDATTKTRREIELPIAAGPNAACDSTAQQWLEMFLALGFREVATVRKMRRIGNVDWRGADVEVALDDVQQVGTFIELELQSDDHGLDAARARLATLAQELQLADSERRSYLELLLERR